MNKKFLLLAVLVVLGVVGLLAFSNRGKAGLEFKGPSMKPTLNDGDVVKVDRAFYEKKRPERNDLVVFRQNNDEFIKRVAALPEEKVTLRNGNLYINGTVFEFPGKGQVQPGAFLLEDQEIVVPANSYFLIGDNPALSYDSINMGFIKEDEITGKVVKKLK